MAEKKENALSAKSSVTSSDYLRLVGSNGVSYKQLVTDVAKYIVENYAGSSLAGSSQAPKTAIDALKTSVDSLNSKPMVNSVSLSSGTDLNDVLTEGCYFNNHGTNYTFSNMPESYSGNFTLQVLEKGGNPNQILIGNNLMMYYRVKFSTGWQPWYKVSATQV